LACGETFHLFSSSFFSILRSLSIRLINYAQKKLNIKKYFFSVIRILGKCEEIKFILCI
jgi:hypothetical protein